MFPYPLARIYKKTHIKKYSDAQKSAPKHDYFMCLRLPIFLHHKKNCCAYLLLSQHFLPQPKTKTPLVLQPRVFLLINSTNYAAVLELARRVAQALRAAAERFSASV